MNTSAARFALLCALVGLGASVAAAYVHYHLLSDPTYVSFCDVSTTVSCTQLYLSRYGTMAGIPVALFGAVGFGAATLLSIGGLTARPSVRENVPGYLFVFSTLALAVVLYLGYASFFIVKSLCILCLITYAAVIGLFVVTGAAASVPMTSLPRRATGDLRVLVSSPLALTLLLLFVMGAGSTLAFFPREGGGVTPASAPAPSQDQRSEFERWFVNQPRALLVVPTEGARVLVVKFNDYRCPPCKQSYLGYKSIFAKYAADQAGAVRLVLKDFPLDGKCNSNVMGAGPHPGACEAAVAVRLARLHGRGEAMEEWLFANQETSTAPVVRQAAHDIGQVNDFDAKFESTLALVKADIEYGRTVGVKSTPTFFMNGVKLEGMLPPQYFDQAISYELQHAPAK